MQLFFKTNQKKFKKNTIERVYGTKIALNMCGFFTRGQFAL